MNNPSGNTLPIEPFPTRDPGGEGRPVAIPVVGVGCSVGGLQALEQFLAPVPADSALAFVVIQHLDPSHPSILPELLRRHTRLTVVRAVDGMRVTAGHVHVLPAGKDMLISRGRLHLVEPDPGGRPRMPVDFFFTSLAEECAEMATGILLSGMGRDGVEGLRAIRERGGRCLAQEPSSAQAGSMPMSAIGAGVVDLVDLPGKLNARIDAFRGAAAVQGAGSGTSLDGIVSLLRGRSGNDFSLYKRNTLHRRIERRMAAHQMDSLAGYLHYLKGNPRELDILFQELLIGVSSFFRDARVWRALLEGAIPGLIARSPGGREFRAWVPACSTGEEAYSLAMVFEDALRQIRPPGRFTLKIFATDLDPDRIATARKGFYSGAIAADVSAERLSRYFTQEGGGYRIGKPVREMVVFARQNVISDPPFTRLDILCCRNLLIYFNAELQRRILPLFNYALNPGGLLLLGSAESIGNFGHLFATVDDALRLYRRGDQVLPISELALPIRAHMTEIHGQDPLRRGQGLEDIGPLTDRLIQQTWAPAALLVNPDGDILYISGRTGKYLEPAAGKVNMNVHAMAREGLRDALAGVIRKALEDPRPIHLDGLRIGEGEDTHVVDVLVQALDKPAPLRGRVIILFRDARAAFPPPGSGVRGGAFAAPDALFRELQQCRESLRAAGEKMQVTVEELRSSNEELQSTNEELQSINEELTTAKDELQSLNEELQTVNAQLQSRFDDLVRERNDMANLVNGTEIAAVFLDDEMRVRRFTAPATRFFKLIPGDVGRALSDIVTDLDYAGLNDDALEVLRTLAFRERTVSARDGRSWRVRILPYRTHENVISGVVISFTEVDRFGDAPGKAHRGPETR